MANENQQNDVPVAAATPPAAPATDAGLGARGASRRRFARAGAGASGVLLTLVSQPGLACEVCRAPSGFQSMKTATTVDSRVNTATCTGKTPDYWRTHAWPSGCLKTRAFSYYFPCSGNANVAFGAASCGSILSPGNNAGEKATIAMYMMAAYLNVLDKRSTFIDITVLRNMWLGYSTHSSYAVNGSVSWGPLEIKEYLMKIME